MSTTFLTDHDEEVMYDLKQHLLFTKQSIPRELRKIRGESEKFRQEKKKKKSKLVVCELRVDLF